MNSSGRQSRKSHHSAYLHGSCNLGIRHKTRNARHEPQRKAEVRLFVAERLPQGPQSTQYTLPLSNCVLLHITYIHLKMPQREGSCSIYGQQSWELYKKKKKKSEQNVYCFHHYVPPLRSTIIASSWFTHIIVRFSYSTLPNVVHFLNYFMKPSHVALISTENMTVGFLHSSVHPCPSSCSEICMTEPGLCQTKPVNAWHLFQMMISVLVQQFIVF